ncbi:Ras-related protein Rab-2B [Diplonema papillatum]|nr:Ras-related protein Rab-2B [Diplonema papillatum]
MEPEDAVEYVFKVLLLGESGVGKTHIVLRFVKGVVAHNTEPTIGVDFYSKLVENVGPQGKDAVRLQIWDTAGAKRYQQSDPRKVYKHAVCLFLVYDVTERLSFEALPGWLASVNATADMDTSKMVVFVVGNKSDLPDPAVSAEEGKAFADERGFQFLETSADKNSNVDKLFEAAALGILSRLPGEAPEPTSGDPGLSDSEGNDPQEQPNATQKQTPPHLAQAASSPGGTPATAPSHKHASQRSTSPGTPPDTPPGTGPRTPGTSPPTAPTACPPEPAQSETEPTPDEVPPFPKKKKGEKDKHDGCGCCAVQ